MKMSLGVMKKYMKIEHDKSKFKKVKNMSKYASKSLNLLQKSKKFQKSKIASNMSNSCFIY